MEKWADYLISCANYTANEERISTVGVHPDRGDDIGVRSTWHRQQVVDSLGKGMSFCTITKSREGKWTKGAKVERYSVDGEWFIKTVANKTKRDNLGELPTCS